jgi:asparagine synthase (glutamine-hydrolysing)
VCGIAGEIHPRGEDCRHSEEQLRCLRHRGADAEGTFRAERAWLGQTRLAVIDLIRGDPPITNEDGKIAVAFNGEIYNFRELRAELVQRGHRFLSDGDTEVLAHLAEDLEPEALAARLDGMFAFAIWDGQGNRLILGRDRLGKKPLYYWANGSRFVFGSEIKAVLANPNVPRELRPEAIPAYLRFGYVPTPGTFFAGIQGLPPGHVMIVEPGQTPRLIRYWEPPLVGVNGVERLRLTRGAATANVRRLLEDSVRRRISADVPLGAFLSGGIDSSSVTALMVSQMGHRVPTFTIGFDEEDVFDERSYARLVAKELGTEHHEFVVHPEAVDLIERLVWHHDQPFGDSSAIPTFLLSEMTGRHVKVALSGDGGDELFAGYERFAAGLAAERYAQLLPVRAQSLVRSNLERLSPSALRGQAGNLQRFTRVASDGLPAAYTSWVSYMDDGERTALLDGRRRPAGDGLDGYCAAWRVSQQAHTLDRLLDLNLRTYLLDDLLVKVDRMSMAHGLEVRSPFLDDQLLDFAVRLEPQLKIRGLSLKRVLRSAVADLLPDRIRSRRKHGFAVPVDRWFRTQLRTYVTSTLGSTSSRVKVHLNGTAVDRMLAEHMSGARNHGQALWTLLTLEVFLHAEDW